MKISKKKILKYILLLIICTSINFLGRTLAMELSLPAWLDCVGTCVAAYFSNPVITILTALFSQLLAGIGNPISLIYSVTALLVAGAFIFCKKKSFMDSLFKMIMVSFWIGLLCVTVSTPLNVILYDGYSGNMWGDALVDMLKWYEFPNVLCAIAGEVVVEIVDKQICVLIAYGFIKLILYFKESRNKAAAKKLFTLLLVMSTAGMSLIPLFKVNASEAESEEYNYISTLYDNKSGMMSSEANVVEQTKDGYIWIGSYAGLTRYDGIEFEFIRDGGMINVTEMMCDSKGRLWIGTNDGGIARYEKGEFTFFEIEDGLSSNSIRSFEEDSDGNIYVGTTDCICRFDENDNITFINERVKYVVSMLTIDEFLAAIDNNGNLYIMNDENIIKEYTPITTGRFYQCIEETSKGILLGTSEGRVQQLVLSNGEWKFIEANYRTNGIINGITEDRNKRLWLCTEYGFGYIDENKRYVDISEKEFDVSFECIMEDYQGNIWLTSTRSGVVKLSESRFSNLFDKAGAEHAVVNAVTEYQQKYYCGTDNGLVIIDKNGQCIENELTELLEKVRIRCFMVDSSNRLWISTYSETGLICYDVNGKIETFNMKESQTTSDRFRCTVELQDGTVVAGTADGINFIKDNKVIDTITVAEDNLPNSQILSLYEASDGTLYAGSDGGGIYLIRNREIVDIYTVENGLSSNVILRIIPYEEGCFIVTSNALCYMENGQIRKLEYFPYFNNYDIIIREQNAYVLCSAGIYVADVEQLLEDDKYEYETLGTSDGLLYGLTANAWNYVNEKGVLYLCSNSGVILYDEKLSIANQEYKFGIVSLNSDGNQIIEDNGIYRIPVDAKDITIRASVYNYALQDVKVRFFVEGITNNAKIISYQELETVQISNLSYGKYKVHFQVFDNSGTKVLQEKKYILDKEAQTWEKTWYKIYLVFICVEIIVFTTWTIISMYNLNKRKQELKENEMFRKMIMALSDTVDAKDRYTSGHSRRVAEYSKMIAERMGKSKKETELIYYSGLLHDVGKIRVPEDVINKPSRLTDEEFELIKIHPVTSYHILKDISEDAMIALGAEFHHERYDGKGYPSGLEGINIPEIARIIGVADSYDAMASNRSYRNALPQDVIREEIVKGKGTQFDPDIADIMLQMIDEDEEYKLKETIRTNKVVLVVDSDESNLQIIKSTLKDESAYRVIGVSDIEDALKLISLQQINLVLLDMDMPQKNGFELLALIREESDVPVIFTSVNKDIEMIKRAVGKGVKDYIIKPFMPVTLKEIIHNVLRG